MSSGHGVGKSVIVAWLVDWLMSTRPFCRGTVTANTFTQLDTKTWASIQTWSKLLLNADWFNVTTARMYHRDHRESWFCAPQSSKEENSEAFAGQHAAGSSSWYVFDEASAIPPKIWEVAEGGLTDGEPFIFAFGNLRHSGPHMAAAHVLLASDHARGTRDSGEGVGRTPRHLDDDAICASRAERTDRCDRLAGWTRIVTPAWRRCGDGTTLNEK